MGFGVPLGTWFRGNLRDYMRETLLAPDARYREMLSGSFVEGLVHRHLSGHANLGPAVVEPRLLRALAADAARMAAAIHSVSTARVVGVLAGAPNSRFFVFSCLRVFVVASSMAPLRDPTAHNENQRADREWDVWPRAAW